jgi:hypothetical protein|tara:strand:- start:1681 stop:2163 length:483 start_codon:yes stop_codon:yes gene_type:complete
MDAIKKSKVKSVQASGTWDGQYGLFYKWEVTMENGDCGQYMGKSETQNKFVIGVEAAYTYDTSKPDFHKIKPFSDFQATGQNNQFTSKVNSKGGSDVQEMIVRQSSLRTAAEFMKNNNFQVNELLAVAELMVDWVHNKEPQKTNGSMEVGKDTMMNGDSQ